MKHVLITGAANGLGKALTHAFAEQGWQVFAADMDETGLPLPGSADRIVPVVMDVTSETAVKEAFLMIQHQAPVLDLIIPNAGIDRYMPLSEAPVEELKEIMEVNFFGVYRINQQFLPLLRSPGGRILLIGSESYHLTFPFMPYPLTKRLIDAYGKVLRQELHFYGIDVVIIRPGAIATRFIRQLSRIQYPVKHPALRKAFEAFASSVPSEVGKTISPAAAADFILRVAQLHRPKAVYRINNSWMLRLASLLPFSVLEQTIRKKLSG